MSAIAGSASLTLDAIDSLERVASEAWNALAGTHEPFLRHEFLSALERNDCLQPYGWHPRHLVVRDINESLVGAMPMYIKTNSYGEFVFDWSWASAYERAGLEYYPKLVISIPYTPVTGPRLLVHPEADGEAIRALLIRQAIELAGRHALTGIHWLFTAEHDTRALAPFELMPRLGCQYHWHNDGYADFEQFLGAFTARRRKKTRRERRRVQEQGVALRIVHGCDADDALWRLIHRLYTGIYDKKFGIPTLTLGFFQELGRTLGEQVVIVLASYQGRDVACAINLRSATSLYGRFWGCDADFHSLHFEACYYQGIDYCIANGLTRFEPGAQGEHKIGRGFLPTRTRSMHWIAHAGFRKAIGDFCRREQQVMEQQCAELLELSPFRAEAAPPTHELSGKSAQASRRTQE